MNHGENVILVPYADDILKTAAVRILSHCSATLPELTHCTVLLPNPHGASGLRRRLLEQVKSQKHQALLGPTICTLDQWLDNRFPPDGEIPGKVQRELLLVDALKQHPDIFGDTNPWHVASDLVRLFDELTRHNIGIPEDIGEFTQLLKEAYGIIGDAPGPLGREASIVHRLWQAWHLQLASNQLTDPGIAHLESLAAAQPDSINDTLFLVGFSEFSRAELDWVSSLLDANKAELLIRYQRGERTQEESEPNPIENILARTGATSAKTKLSTRAECLEAVFSVGEQPLGERAREFQTRYPDSPLADNTRIFPAASAEQEACAIDIRIRQWLLEGKQSIGFVTGDRRLARRVRALLERAGVPLQDIGGWALSTTSAAATLERWLETIEEDFAHQPLLDTLKSPFVLPDSDREQHLKTVYHLEQDIVHRENIARGLHRYHRQIDYRANRLPSGWTSHTAGEMHTLLNTLDQAADPLRNLIDGEPHPLTRLLDALYESLKRLGIRDAFEDDPAGRRILGEWQLLREAAGKTPLEINWTEFRNWFGSALEHHDFHLADNDSPVHLLTLEQAQLDQYDAVVIGACNREYLPGKSTVSPFFNHSVRAELGLPTWQSHYRLRLGQFRSALERAPRLLLTYTHDKKGAAALPSPWLEALRAFHQLAYQDNLKDPVLDALTRHPDARVSAPNKRPLPEQTTRPAPVLNAALQPQRLSASAHQQLIDCPYRFYAAYGLNLKAREDVSEALGKSGYGERVHQCLEAFHGNHPFFPGPFEEPCTANNRDRAIRFLEKISQAVFSHDIEDNFERRIWLKQWQLLIPEYIDWQIEHQQSWDVSRVEVKETVQLTGSVTLEGRLDRVDAGPDGFAIIDYKTGQIPKQAAVDSGEAVQLPTYVMLVDEKTTRVDYLQFSNKSAKVEIGGGIETPALDDLAVAVRKRLVTLIDQIHQGAALPAWGDSKTCQYCDMDGLCRRQVWNAAADGASPYD